MNQNMKMKKYVYEVFTGKTDWAGNKFKKEDPLNPYKITSIGFLTRVMRLDKSSIPQTNMDAYINHVDWTAFNVRDNMYQFKFNSKIKNRVGMCTHVYRIFYSIQCLFNSVMVYDVYYREGNAGTESMDFIVAIDFDALKMEYERCYNSVGEVIVEDTPCKKNQETQPIKIIGSYFNFIFEEYNKLSRDYHDISQNIKLLSKKKSEILDMMEFIEKHFDNFRKKDV